MRAVNATWLEYEWVNSATNAIEDRMVITQEPFFSNFSSSSSPTSNETSSQQQGLSNQDQILMGCCIVALVVVFAACAYPVNRKWLTTSCTKLLTQKRSTGDDWDGGVPSLISLQIHTPSVGSPSLVSQTAGGVPGMGAIRPSESGRTSRASLNFATFKLPRASQSQAGATTKRSTLMRGSLLQQIPEEGKS